MDISYDLFLILVPVIILQLALMIVAFLDWRKQPRDMPDRWIWLALILLLQTIGPVIYFLVAPRVSSEEKWLEEMG